MIGAHAKKVTASLKAIPRETLSKKIFKTIIGLGFIGFSVFMAKISAPWYMTAASFGVGMHIISAELVGKSVKFFVAVVRDVFSAKKGADDTDSETPG